MKAISKFLFKVSGWKIEGSIPNETKRAVMVIAPHTSLWDFIMGRLAFNILNRKVSFIIKKEFFFFPLGYLLKLWGGIPVDREKGSRAFNQLNIHFEKNDHLILVVTPEGTRKPVKRWKKGFYLIAQQNEVPLILGALDYKKKIAYISNPITIKGEYKKDLEEIKAFYRTKNAKFPEKFNPNFY